MSKRSKSLPSIQSFPLDATDEVISDDPNWQGKIRESSAFFTSTNVIEDTTVTSNFNTSKVSGELDPNWYERLRHSRESLLNDIVNVENIDKPTSETDGKEDETLIDKPPRRVDMKRLAIDLNSSSGSENVFNKIFSARNTEPQGSTKKLVKSKNTKVKTPSKIAEASSRPDISDQSSSDCNEIEQKLQQCLRNTPNYRRIYKKFNATSSSSENEQENFIPQGRSHHSLEPSSNNSTNLTQNEKLDCDQMPSPNDIQVKEEQDNSSDTSATLPVDEPDIIARVPGFKAVERTFMSSNCSDSSSGSSTLPLNGPEKNNGVPSFKETEETFLSKLGLSSKSRPKENIQNVSVQNDIMDGTENLEIKEEKSDEETGSPAKSSSSLTKKRSLSPDAKESVVEIGEEADNSNMKRLRLSSGSSSESELDSKQKEVSRKMHSLKESLNESIKSRTTEMPDISLVLADSNLDLSTQSLRSVAKSTEILETKTEEGADNNTSISQTKLSNITRRKTNSSTLSDTLGSQKSERDADKSSRSLRSKSRTPLSMERTAASVEINSDLKKNTGNKSVLEERRTSGKMTRSSQLSKSLNALNSTKSSDKNESLQSSGSKSKKSVSTVHMSVTSTETDSESEEDLGGDEILFEKREKITSQSSESTEIVDLQSTNSDHHTNATSPSKIWRKSDLVKEVQIQQAARKSRNKLHTDSPDKKSKTSDSNNVSIPEDSVNEPQPTSTPNVSTRSSNRKSAAKGSLNVDCTPTSQFKKRKTTSPPQKSPLTRKTRSSASKKLDFSPPKMSLSCKDITVATAELKNQSEKSLKRMSLRSGNVTKQTPEQTNRRSLRSRNSSTRSENRQTPVSDIHQSVTSNLDPESPVPGPSTQSPQLPTDLSKMQSTSRKPSLAPRIKSTQKKLSFFFKKPSESQEHSPNELALKYPKLQHFNKVHGPFSAKSDELNEIKMRLMQDDRVMQETKRIMLEEAERRAKLREESCKKKEAEALARKKERDLAIKREARERKKKEREARMQKEVEDKIKRKPLYRRKHWCTEKLNKYLEAKMKSKHGLDTKMMVEKVMCNLVACVDFIVKAKKYEDYKALLGKLKRMLARNLIVVTHEDFYFFCHDYMPYKFRIKAIPMWLPEIGLNIPDYDPKTDDDPILQT